MNIYIVMVNLETSKSSNFHAMYASNYKDNALRTMRAFVIERFGFEPPKQGDGYQFPEPLTVQHIACYLRVLELNPVTSTEVDNMTADIMRHDRWAAELAKTEYQSQ